MDEYGVPKKVNRHVLNALYTQKKRGYEYASFTEIYNLVHFAIRNGVPVKDLPSAVRQSLQNMCQLGIICKNGPDYFFPYCKLKDHRNVKNIVVPNLKRGHPSDNSLTDSDVTKVRKPFHAVKKRRRRQRSVGLPKVRKVRNNNKEFSNNKEKTERDGSVKKHLTSQMSDTETPPQNDRNQKSNKAPDGEENQNNNSKDRLLTPKTESASKEAVTTEKKNDKAKEKNSNTSPNNS